MTPLPVIAAPPKMALGPLLRAAHAAVLNKDYQRSPIGREVGRYLGSLRWAGNPRTTLDSYESVLAPLAVDFDDFAGAADFCSQVGAEYLAEFLDRRWGECSPATKAHHHSVLRAFFAWGVGEGRLPFHPMQAMRSPRRRTGERLAPPRASIALLLAEQESLRDVVALRLCCHLGFRRNELRLCRIRDLDLIRQVVLVHGKGGKDVLLPLSGWPSFVNDVTLHVQVEGRHADEYLLYARERRFEPMHSASVQRWFKRCLARAGLPSSLKLHELRHFAADELWRETGNIVLAQMLLRHESVGTTQTYLHPTREDLVAGMLRVAEAWEAGE